MRLQISLPTGIVFDDPVQRVVAETTAGAYCLLPRHTDFLAATVPGLLDVTSESGEQIWVAVDEGLLVKKNDLVSLATRNAIIGTDLAQLRRTVVDEFESLDDRERTARSAMAKLESDFVRRFLALGEQLHVG